MQVVDLESRIYTILSADGTDLSTISAKRVRRRLLEQEDVPQELIKDNKKAIDQLISAVFAKVSEEKGFQQDEDDEEAAAGGPTRDGSPEPAPVPPQKRPRPSRDSSQRRSTAAGEALAPVPLPVPRVAAVGVVADGGARAGEGPKPMEL